MTDPLRLFMKHENGAEAPFFNRMKIQFLGTGAAEGVPAVFCNCDYCKKIRLLGEEEFRTRSQVLIDGVLSVDFPPDAYAHSLRFGVEFGKLKYLLVTHSHMDHFYAHDFILHGYKYAKSDNDLLQIYGNSEVKSVFDECTRREMKPEVAPHLAFRLVAPFQTIMVGEYKVIVIPASHEKKEDCLLYYIERAGKGYLHLYDTGRMKDEAFDYLAMQGARADVVAFDCTFTDRVGGEGARHMGIEDNRLMKEKLMTSGVINADTKLIVTHFSHNADPTRARLAEIEKKYGVTAAYDGMELVI